VIAVGWEQWAPIVVAATPGVLALIGVLLNNRAQRRSGTDIEKLRRSLDDRSRQRAMVQRYQEPLARAVFDLQSRLWNILRQSFLQAYASDLESREWLYARDSTVWLFAQYFGWVEIVRREIQFIPFGEDDQSRQLQMALEQVARVCSTDTWINDGAFQVYRSEQRALGELVITDGHDAEGKARTSCMGFAAFRAALEDSESSVARWFAPLQADITAAAHNGAGQTRVRQLQHALIDLVEILDPGPAHVRFPRNRERA
jgi:hypothetical protein